MDRDSMVVKIRKHKISEAINLGLSESRFRIFALSGTKFGHFISED